MEMNRNILFGLAISLAGYSQAQEAGHYLDFNIGGGYHGIKAEVENGNSKGGLGYTANLGYKYFFSPGWGIGTGIGMQSYQSKITLNHVSSANSVDTDGDSYYFCTSYNNWQEKQKMLLLGIPVGLCYRTNLGQKLGLQATLGGMISIPVKTSYETCGGEIVTTGYYSQWEVELSDMPQHNVETITGFAGSDFKSNLVYSAFADLGILYPLTGRFDFYLGGHVNYGLNNFLDKSDKPVYQEDGVYNGVFTSSEISRASLLALGVKIGIVIRLGKRPPRDPDIMTDIAVNKPLTTPDQDLTRELPGSTSGEQTIPGTETTLAGTGAGTSDTVDETGQTVDMYALARDLASRIKPRFAYNSQTSLITNDEKIDSLARILEEYPAIKLRVVGHTCDIDSREKNSVLGMRRAESVKALLVSKGVPASQVTAESKYYSEPLVPNTSEANRSMNRRVELFVE